MVKIKICGIKNEIEAKSVCECEYNGKKVDFIGLIFAPSKRQVDLLMAAKISKIAHKNAIKIAGVFDSVENAKNIAKLGFLDAIQIYEKLDNKILLNAKNASIWQVFSVDVDCKALAKINGDYDMALFDCKGAKLGGNGVSFDWEILRDVKLPFGIAGGLDENNFQKALKFKPTLLDFNSRLEDENGQKIQDKIIKILKILHNFKAD